jgi:hypothetical protein
MTPPPLGTNITLQNVYDNTDNEKIVLGGRGWTPVVSRKRYWHESTPAGKNISYPQDKTTNSESKMMVEPPTRAAPSATKPDSYLDNKVGDIIRKAKAKHGKAPFIEAYKNALNISRDINDRRKKCLEEEVRLRSVLRAGED